MGGGGRRRGFAPGATEAPFPLFFCVGSAGVMEGLLDSALIDRRIRDGTARLVGEGASLSDISPGSPPFAPAFAFSEFVPGF
jgi:hypothetical protein